jgi:hypothetical protein
MLAPIPDIAHDANSHITSLCPHEQSIDSVPSPEESRYDQRQFWAGE